MPINIDPVAFSLGNLNIHWYGIMYSLSFLISYIFFTYGEKFLQSGLTQKHKENILIYSIIAVLVGGRIGYILFYNLNFYILNPHKLLTVWEGGMSFHGGLLAVLLFNLIYAKKHKIHLLKITDLISSVAPLGLFLGRIGNFINGELYGRISTNNQFCFFFPTDPTNCRYPSQLLEAVFEGLVLFVLINLIKRKNHRLGLASGVFLIGYGTFRFLIEFLREPDVQLGFILNNFTMGQLLSLPLIIAGIFVLKIAAKQSKTKS